MKKIAKISDTRKRPSPTLTNVNLRPIRKINSKNDKKNIQKLHKK